LKREDGKEEVPVIVHRAIFGSLERMMGVLTEHLKGKSVPLGAGLA
jgi:threonyl-tRNA synthetase